MKIIHDTERKLVQLGNIAVGNMFLYNVEPNSDKLTLFIKRTTSDCYEVGGTRSFGFAASTGVHPVLTLTVTY